jgi:high-affinity nickel-transport protein
MFDFIAQIDSGAAGVGVLITGLLLGIRHGIDWDHIAAITDITSTTAAASAAEAAHAREHRGAAAHEHRHGGMTEMQAHGEATESGSRPARPAVAGGAGAAVATTAVAGATVAGAAIPRAAVPHRWFRAEQMEAIRLGTLYAVGHGIVVIVLGIAALAFGALLPDWLDPIMGRVVGLTLVGLGVWVLYSVYRFARGGGSFRLRSRWMLVFDGVRYAWRRLQARLHGHEHVEPLEMSSYGTRTALGVGMIHGIGAETGTQVLLIAAVGGASSAGLGVPMLLAFVLGLLISNFVIVVVSSVGFVASQTREMIYVAVGAVAGVFSLIIGFVFLLGLDGVLPDLESMLPF